MMGEGFERRSRERDVRKWGEGGSLIRELEAKRCRPFASRSDEEALQQSSSL